VALLAFDVADEADTARVLLVVVEVEALAGRHGAIERVWVTLDGIEAGDRLCGRIFFD
jgi:hypothetical protein